ncbi:hypothetical protein FGG78_20735 [Thioclava sp. BHET1]|nr:hypothetical protein FGG78_20735 [Thioclava sp. BHET1]
MLEYKVGRLKGRFVVTWKDDAGQRHRFRLAAATAREADAEARDVLITATANAGDITVEKLLHGYREEYAGRSIAESMRHTGKSILPWFGHFRPDQITPEDCRAYIADRRAAISPYVIEWGGRQVKSIKRGFAAATQAAGLDDVTPHTLRHTAAVHMAAAGVPMEKISQYLGHSNTATTERVYARFAPDHLRDAADALDFAKLKSM